MRDRQVRLVECVDEILHFFVIRATQMDFTAFTAEQRDLVYTVLDGIYYALVESFAELVEVSPRSRMVLKHRRFLALVKEEHDLEEA